MIIDFHTHTYPSMIANKVVSQLSGPSQVNAFTDATNEGLVESCRKYGISKCVLLPVVTNPSQTETINNQAITNNESSKYLISFGGIHPENQNFKNIISSLKSGGIKGIKLHPVFQNTYIDDIKYMRIIDCACEHELIISVHAGLDINSPSSLYSSIPHIRKMLKTLQPPKMILAHMGGHLCWNEAEEMLQEYIENVPCGNSLYLDTAFSLPSPIASQNINYEFLSTDQFIRLVRLVGSEHILFGTDSPWTDQGQAIKAINNSGITNKEASQIFYKNAKDLLNLNF